MVLLCHLISRIIPPNLFCSLKCTKLQLWYTLRSHRTTGLILGMLSVFESFSIFRKAMDSSGRDVWLSNGTYWKVRENPGFANTNNLELWWRNALGPFGGLRESNDKNDPSLYWNPEDTGWELMKAWMNCPEKPTFYHHHLICTPKTKKTSRKVCKLLGSTEQSTVNSQVENSSQNSLKV